MLRITENQENNNTLRLRLDGTLTAETFADLETAWRQRSDKSEMIILDMGGVNFMNEAAAQKLAQIKSERVRIINCSPFIAVLLDTIERSNQRSK